MIAMLVTLPTMVDCCLPPCYADDWIIWVILLDTIVVDEYGLVAVKKDSRWEGGPLNVHDDSVVAMISHATEQRLKCLIEKIKSISKKRVDLAANVSFVLLERMAPIWEFI